MLTVLNRHVRNCPIMRLKRTRAGFKPPILNAGPTRNHRDTDYTPTNSKHPHLRKAKHGLQIQSV